MGQKVPPGLIKRGNVWHIKKKIGAKRVFRSTGTSDLAEAERFLAHVIEEIRNAQIYGLRPKRTFRLAATRYLKEATKASIADDAMHLRTLNSFIGDLSLEAIHMGSIQSFIQHRKEQGVKVRTINYALQTVRHILNIAASEWFDETGMTWLDRSPRIKLLPETDKRSPYPLSWDEQFRLLSELPKHLAKMALFKVNTGCREAEVCNLKWE